MESEKQTGWQPIETAPKDGTIIIAAYQYHPVRPAYWNGECWMTFGCITEGGEEPYHWQPLPAPPGTTRAPADLRSALEAETIERCAKVAEEQAQQNAQARRDRADDALAFEFDGLGSVIATAIRALAPTKEPAA